MVHAFAQAGMRLVVADLDDGMLAETLSEVERAGAEVIGRRCDVSDLSQVEALAASALDRFGAVHVLCNNAGVGIPTPTDAIDLDVWRWIIDVDLWGPIYGVKVFLPIMEAQGEGHINATSSMAGLVAAGTLGAYNVAKHGIVGLMTTLERDLRGRGSAVRSSVLCPGPIRTQITRHSALYRPAADTAATPDSIVERATANIQSAIEEGMDPDEVGHLVLEAIRQDTFWVLTHPRMARLVSRQVDALSADGSLTGG